MSKHRKAHPNIPTVYATNCAIVAGCYCGTLFSSFAVFSTKSLIVCLFFSICVLEIETVRFHLPKEVDCLVMLREHCLIVAIF